MKEFKAAAKAAEGESEEVLEFAIDGEEFVAELPSTARVAMFVASMSDDSTTGDAVGAIFSFLKDVLQGDGYRRLRKMISDSRISLGTLTGGGDENDEGIVDWIIGQASDRPTPESSDSSPSPAASGLRSTGRSPGKGSTRSSSLSPVS